MDGNQNDPLLLLFIPLQPEGIEGEWGGFVTTDQILLPHFELETKKTTLAGRKDVSATQLASKNVWDE